MVSEWTPLACIASRAEDTEGVADGPLIGSNLPEVFGQPG